MRYFIGFLVMVALIITLIVMLFNGGDKPAVPNTTKKLTDYANTDARVSMTIDGPINASSEHEQVRVTVDRNNVTYEHIKGYDGQVADTKIFENTENAYDVFLHALMHAGFTNGNNESALRDDRGYCPTGDRYIFELSENNDRLQRYWATSCGGVRTYDGALNLTLTLFKAQVPDYSGLTGNIQF
ncbi:MAG TPA: hypothetical protein VD706_02650 [Candidatus Saccharimonadales bacterium]|nr:hypothetical protein [Candidatus Saccharimonadales bacterium]